MKLAYPKPKPPLNLRGGFEEPQVCNGARNRHYGECMGFVSPIRAAGATDLRRMDCASGDSNYYRHTG